MERKLPKIMAGTVVILTFSLSGFAQNTDKRVSQKSVSENGQPSLITFSEKSSYKEADYNTVFKEQLGLKENQSFSKVKKESDKEGFTHEKFQLYEQGVKVEFANYTIHSKEGKVVSMNGEFYKLENVKTTPKLSSQAAFDKAIAYTGAKQYLWETPADAAAMDYKKPKGELVLLPSMDDQGKERKSDKVRLAYKFDIYATKPLSRGDLYIDAQTGEALFYNATIKHLGENSHGRFMSAAAKEQSKNATSKLAIVAANAATRYSGTQTIQTTLSGSSYILSDGTRGNGVQTYNSAKTATYPTTNFTDADNNWTAAEYNNTNKDNGALDAHWGAEMTYDYWSAVHGRNSYDNAGAKIKSYVHYNLVAAGYPDNNNAFWNGSVMTYGDGSGTGGFDILTALDVAGHEIGHAVCTYTANLAYQKESGAMNEAFSDIWGACIEYRAAPTKSTWLVGEDIERRSGHLALRSMSDPNSEGQPDTYGGTYWVNVNCTPTNNNDQCGVHTNSGVLNHWFYILSVGKTGTNDIGNAYNVTGITIDKAAKIAFRLESVYLTSNSTYANARTSGIQSAIDLYGAGSAEVIATTNAFYAVGVGAAYSGSTDTVAPSAPTALAAAGTTGSSTNLTWTASTDNVAVTGYDIYQGATLKGSSTTTSYTVTGLTALTAYTFTVKAKDAAGNVSAASNAVNVTTTAASVAYCTSKGNSATDERISKVVFGTINKTSTATTGYEDFTATSTNAAQGTAYTITITPTWTSSVYSEGYAVFIDYNQDGDFSDSGETVFTKAASTASTATGSITIPATATLGTTRLRVSMKYNAIPTSCESFSYGQVEDYTINITASGGIVSEDVTAGLVETVETSSFALYPNPVGGELNVSFANSEGYSFRIINTLGQQLKTGLLSGNLVDVSNLSTGIYIIELNKDDKKIVKKFVKK
ncbi:putative secreted protein (Por secretion system target) [Flavobacterium sp. 90]|uniref:M4 family metallopeptidase n=1 Tax=unclassified Flavobacterium TaxID=196869 RepID=UPI000EAF5DB8|nr:MULTISPECIES: M4 family metallopeptidase [unclassified Flavobacterium]RKR10339.1 putative secreted protein (Por secretion system target) [Flavobacterium sp. 81]TCK54124.1 putative secreted protein (Por secretion system target) [Flavobacterium sp. 90]